MYTYLYILYMCVHNFHPNNLNYREVYASLSMFWGLLQEISAIVHIQILHMHCICIYMIYMRVSTCQYLPHNIHLLDLASPELNQSRMPCSSVVRRWKPLVA